MKKLWLFNNIALSLAVVLLVSCGNNNAQENNEPSEVEVHHLEDQSGKVDIPIDTPVVNTEHHEGSAGLPKEAGAQGATGKGNQPKPEPGNKEVIQHKSDDQQKVDSIKQAKTRQREN